MRGLRLLVATTAVAAVVLLSAAPAPAADEDSIRIPTSWITHAEFRAGGARVPGDLLAAWSDEGGAALSAEPPAATGAVPPGVRLQYGTVTVAGRSFLVALGMKDGDMGVVAVDLNGDRNLNGPGEVMEKKGHIGRHAGVPVLRWKFPKQTLGQMGLELEFRQLLGCCNAILVAPAGQQPLTLSMTPPAGVQPPQTTSTVQYSTVTDTQGAMTFAFVRGDGDSLTVLADGNRNGVLGEAGEVFPAVVQSRDSGTLAWLAQGVPYGGGAASLAFRHVDPQGQVMYKARSLGARRGTVRRGEHDYALHLLDADFDGTFTSAGDWWWFGPQRALEAFSKIGPDSMLEANHPFYVDAAWRLISIDPAGNAVLMKDSEAGEPHEYFHSRTEHVNQTRYFPHFARDAQFPLAHGIDASRPKAAAAPTWYHDVGLRAALARAKAEGKPLLVDFEADWCNICKRWDYHVYSDQEVASLLAQFVLLKVNVDFNFADDMVRLGGEGPPYLVFLDGDGNPLLSFPEIDETGQETGKNVNGLNHFQRPQDFAATLKAAIQSCASRRGG